MSRLYDCPTSELNHYVNCQTPARHSGGHYATISGHGDRLGNRRGRDNPSKAQPKSCPHVVPTICTGSACQFG